MHLELPPPPFLAGWLDRWFLCRVATRVPAVALTFDDGPDPVATPRVLEVLAREGHSATFFFIGERARRHPRLVRAVADAGHEVANHTYSHRLLPLLSRRGVLEELRRAEWVLSGLAGRAPRHFRPPSGWATPAVLRWIEEEGYRSVLGSIYPADPHAPDAAAVVRRAVPRLAPGRILILHDGCGRRGIAPPAVEALPAILAQLGARGLRGLSVEALLAESAHPAARWGAGGVADAAPGAVAVSEGRARGRPEAAAPGSRS